MSLSVILCTHNPRKDYLQRTLQGLARQTLPQGEWELLLVDNGSAAPLSDDRLPEWRDAWRIVREERLGLTPARLRGIRESRGELLVFVDDDNVLERDYLEVALALASAHPEVGVFSASISPEYEVEPHPAIGLFEPYLAIRRLTADVIGKRAGPHVLPIGAGMVVRRGIAEVHAAAVEGGTGRLELDRKGDSLLAAGDTDLGYTALDKGYACGSFQALRVTHLIPARRVQSNYLFKLVEDVTYSQLLLARMRGAPGSSRARAIKQRVALIFFKLHPNRMLAGYRSALLRARLRAGTVG